MAKLKQVWGVYTSKDLLRLKQALKGRKAVVFYIPLYDSRDQGHEGHLVMDELRFEPSRRSVV